MHYADPPVLLRDVIDDVGDVVELFEQNAPYTPLGGWYNPGADPHARTRPMWFQNDWVHADLAVDGSDLFLWHEGVIDATKQYYGAEIVEPQSIYVNLMAAIDAGGPAHTDNPRFVGRGRTNTPMWLLRVMLWSGLFERWVIKQSTSIWWLNDVEGGGLYYWPNGPDEPPAHHVGAMANTALVGDNHGMFHQVGPVGPFDQGTRLVSPSAELAPDGTGDWVVTDHGEELYRAPFDDYRVSVLWKADVYVDADERAEQHASSLSMHDVANVFNADLEERADDVRVDAATIESDETRDELNRVYPESRPVGALASVYD